MTASTPDAPLPAVDGTASLLIMMARLEGKVDVALTAQGAKVDEHARRLDSVERNGAATDDRLREVERRPSVTPLAALGGAAAIAAIVAAATPFLDRLYS